jgi:hypothetical protein
MLGENEGEKQMAGPHFRHKFAGPGAVLCLFSLQQQAQLPFPELEKWAKLLDRPTG